MSDSHALYQELILDHARLRLGYGLLASADAQSHQLNPLCGDEITLQLHVRDGAVSAISWEGSGCAISTASASLLAQVTPGSSPGELRHRIRAFRAMLQSRGAEPPDAELLGDAVALHGVARYPARVKCAMLAWVACETALHDLGD